MANLYVASNYIVTGYVVGDETNIYDSVIRYNMVDDVSAITYNFKIKSQSTGLPVELGDATEVTMTDGKRFTMPAGVSTYSVSVPKTSMISRIDFETLPALTNVNVMDTMIGNKKVELVDKIIGTTRSKSIVVSDGGKLSTLPETAKVTLTSGEVFYLSDLSRKATINSKTNVAPGITKISVPDTTGGSLAPITITSTTSANNQFTIMNANTSPELPAKSIYHSSKGTESVDQMGLNAGSLVFDNAVSLTGKVYYKIDEDILTVNKIKSFKNVRNLFNLIDLRK